MARDDWLSHVLALCEAWWSGQTDVVDKAIARIKPVALEVARQHGRRAVKRLLALGHYDAASVCFDGSWYVGIDRLHYLLERLDGLGLVAHAPTLRELRARQRALRPGIELATRPTIEFFFSFRSPFSYLAATTTFALARAGKLDVVFRPVLPMVKRGLPLPNAKRYYIVADANREARRLGVPFGRIADPLDAAPDLIRVAALAEQEGRVADFVLAAGRASWADGIDLRKPANLTAVARSAGLLPNAIARALRDDAPLSAAEQNMQRLAAVGLWGVPSFKLGTTAYFGQDRLALMLNQASGDNA